MLNLEVLIEVILSQQHSVALLDHTIWKNLFERIFKLLLPVYENNYVNIKINTFSAPKLTS